MMIEVLGDKIMYQKDILKEYILNSEIRKFSKEIKVRLSKDLAIKYDKGLYKNALLNIQNNLKMINSLNIHYPANANPILYVYIVPDDRYAQLLRMPKHFDKGMGGGKPVNCYDLDGFNRAYGLSQNLLENKSLDVEISKKVNEIHELSHIIHSQFFSKNRTICEGFAEALPLYALELEELFDDHRNIILQLDENQILSAQELLASEKDGSYGVAEALPNKSCSFRYSYISSYLFVRGYLETLVELYDISKAEATQKFLEIIRQNNYINEWLIFDIAKDIGISPETLLNSKDIHTKSLNSIKLIAHSTSNKNNILF